MAPSSKKKRTSPPTKNTGTRRRTGKKRASRNKGRSSLYKRMGHLFLILSGIFLLVGAGYCLGRCWMKENRHVEKTTPLQHKPQSTTSYKRVTAPAEKTAIDTQKSSPKSRHTTAKSIQKVTHVKLAYRQERPRLAIIIDDVHTQQQLQTIGALPMPVTPSIFPPYTLSPDTPRLATQAAHYMIHLPMESGNAKFDAQSKTLKRYFTQAQMDARIHELRRLFPRAHFVNNHTGSLFTSDETAMMRLYRAMRQEGFAFIDSRTSVHSTVGTVVHRFGDDYVARDIFLDNIKSVPYIRTQLKKAVRLAKKNGYAIAIGHPHPVTMQALREAKPLLKEVEIVYIDALFRRY